MIRFSYDPRLDKEARLCAPILVLHVALQCALTSVIVTNGYISETSTTPLFALHLSHVGRKHGTL